MQFKYNKAKSEKLKKDPRRRIGFEKVKEIWTHYHYVDCRSDDPEQLRAIGWVRGKLFTAFMKLEKIRTATIITL
jgi:hypothetical protein